MIVNPKAIKYELLLTADTAISHHDPAVQDDSNRMLFNRQKQILRREGEARTATIEKMAQIAAAHPVPVDVAEIVRDLSFPEFAGVVLARLFMDMYNSMDGSGLFEGMQRYDRLETRLRQAAIPSVSLRAWWDRMCRALNVGIHAGSYDVALFDLLSLPGGTQQQVLRVLVADYRSIIAIARLWHTTAKLGSEAYAKKAGVEAMVQPLMTLEFAESAQVSNLAQVLEMPAVSGNSLRHQVVREPSWLHLCAALGLKAANPGQGPVPQGCEAIFVNGGNIEAGAKQPSNVFVLAHQARALYPSLDLLGGVTDSFDLGESRLRVAGWLVCAENKPALRGSPAYDLPNASISVFDMIDDVTLTRQAGTVGVGQMIFSFETLAAGAQVLCELVLTPQTALLTHGVLVAAVETFLAEDRTIGGSASRGFGHCQGQWLTRPDDGTVRQQYEDYLEMNRDRLVAGLIDGTLGTGSRILS